MPAVQLSPTPDLPAVLAAAEAAAGLRDFGGGCFRTSLESLVRLLNTDPDIPDDRRAAAYSQVVNVLAGRLRLVEDRKRHPEIDQEKIEAPLIVMGFGRSGTTFLHSLLAEDPAGRAPAYWEVARPSPPPGKTTPPDARIEAGHDDIKQWLAELPGFITQHPYWDQGGLALMECESFLVYDLRNHYPIQLSKIPFGRPWVVGGDEIGRFRFHRWFLQQLQYGAPSRRWVLKGVDHQFFLSGLRAVYPNALLVWAHRDPAQVFGSLLEVTYEITRGTGGDTADRVAFAQSRLERHRTNLDQALTNPLAGDPAICHVRYPDMIADPVGTVRGIYRHFTLPLSAEFESRMRAWIADPANRPDRHGKWTYSLPEFGLDDGSIREMFADYRNRFSV
jgi:Sulfotransferase family